MNQVLLTTLLVSSAVASGVVGPECGNGIVEGLEMCETTGANCLSNCTCSRGFVSTVPKSVNCLGSGTANLSSVLHCSSNDTIPNFACVGNVTVDYLECRSGNLVFKPCPPGTTCDGTSNSSATTTNPCTVSKSQCHNNVVEPGEQCESNGALCGDDCHCLGGSVATVPVGINCVPVSGGPSAVCGNGFTEGSEECDPGSGVNCNTNCTCDLGFNKTTPVSANCLPPFMANLSLVCSRFEGFACLENITSWYLSCRSGVPEFFSCPAGAVCRNYNVSTTNPCAVVGNGLSPVCGNAVVEGNEQCEVSGRGCTVNCTCQSGLVPTIPTSAHCVQKNVSDTAVLCDNSTGFTCIPELVGQFVVCSVGSRAIVDCPANTTGCSVTNTTTTFNPCIVSDKRSCGNGKADIGEDCDGGANCRADCTCSGNTVATTPPSQSCTLCGNRAVDANEDCDSGSGCNSVNCTCQLPFVPTSPKGLNCTLCGNLQVDIGEECDSNSTAGSGCLSNCTCSHGFNATTPPSLKCVSCNGPCQHVPQQRQPRASAPCGGAVLQGGEECEVV